MSKERLIKVHNWFYKERGFKWISDKERLGKWDHWEVLQNENGVFEGDCEDAALTIMNKLIEEGVPHDRLFIVRCATEVIKEGNLIDHAILGYVEDEEWYFSDNRYQSYPACDLRSLGGYKLYDAVSVDNLMGVGKPLLFEKG